MFLKVALLAGAVLATGLSGPASAQGIYTCVDAKGRRLTADRPIAECMDRTQKVLTPSGTISREVGPSLTAHELIVQDANEKLMVERRARETEEKRRNRALLLRYPSREVHDQERATALQQIDQVIGASGKRTLELADQRKGIENELEFYVRDPSRAPTGLKRRRDENSASVQSQRKFMVDQEQEKLRVNLRFDDELIKLRQLWALRSGDAAPGDPSPASASASAPIPAGPKRSTIVH